MDRRTFSRNAASLAGALALAGAGVPGGARAQGGAPVENRDYAALPRPVAVPANGKIEVIEFFWYACPHCYTFEPLLERWLARLATTLPGPVIMDRARLDRPPDAVSERLGKKLATS